MDTLYFRITGVATTLDVDARYMDNPWIHCIPELLCQGPGLKPHYPTILGSKPGPRQTHSGIQCIHG